MKTKLERKELIALLREREIANARAVREQAERELRAIDTRVSEQQLQEIYKIAGQHVRMDEHSRNNIYSTSTASYDMANSRDLYFQFRLAANLLPKWHQEKQARIDVHRRAVQRAAEAEDIARRASDKVILEAIKAAPGGPELLKAINSVEIELPDLKRPTPTAEPTSVTDDPEA